jgi:hypothetical protein
MNNQLISNFLLIDLSFLKVIASNYTDGLIVLRNSKEGPEKFLYPFCLLATTALELFLKVIIGAEMCAREGVTKKEIEEFLKRKGHNISQLIKEASIQKDCRIQKVEIERNGIVSDYRIFFDDGEFCYFKDSESIRYGALAKRKDIAVFIGFHYKDKIIDFLKDLEDLSEERINSSKNTLSKK